MGHSVRSILRDTYGKTPMVDALAEHLDDRIIRDSWPRGYNDREREIMLICWDWFPGGSTAEAVAHKIEAVLDA